MYVNVTRLRPSAAAALLRNGDTFRFRKHLSLFSPPTRLDSAKFSFQSFQRAQPIMHAIDTGIWSARPQSNIPVVPPIEPCFNFTTDQMQVGLEDPNIAQLIANKTALGEFFYGIEVTAHTKRKTTCLDFNEFLPMMPLFISVVWISVYSEVLANSTTSSLDEVANVRFSSLLKSRIPAMPHLALYRLSRQHLDDFFDLNLRNVLVIRGDKLHDGQAYRYAYQAVEHARRQRGDKISIAVAGYPEGYTNLNNGTQDLNEVTQFLKKKIDVGANFILTQICFSVDKILTFLRNTRNAGIEAPIVLGITVPHSYEKYRATERISRVRLPTKLRCELDKIKHDDAKTEAFFVQLMVDIIQKVLASNLGVYGVQFYTMNHFPPVIKVLCELRRLGILKKPTPAPCDAA